MNITEVDFESIRGKEITEAELSACQQLYSAHYGIWGKGSGRDGQRIWLSREYLKGLVSSQKAWVAFARFKGELIGYAFAIREEIPDCGLLTWVTQLVVHAEYRHEGVATSLLGSIWGFSDDCGWGLVTANPYAVRALEKATRRRCTPGIIEKYLPHLQQVE